MVSSLAFGACAVDDVGRDGLSGVRGNRSDEIAPGGTCEGACGDQAAAGCWCDEMCQGFGDCCGDFEPVCLDVESDAPADDPTDDPTGDPGDGEPAGDGGAGDGGAPGTVTAQDLLDITADCKRLPGTDLFATDAGKTRTIEICQLEGAIWWRADADIDCDGGKSSPCTEDPWYQSETSSKDSSGNFIDSSTVPHFVVPLPSGGFTPKDYGIKTGWSAYGSAGAIIYDGKLIYAPYADAGPKNVVGELSAAAAAELGIPNHPVTGGVDSGVTYIVFTGPGTYVDPIESRDAAESLGSELAAQLLANN